MTIDRSKTIEQLEQKYWGAPLYSSYLVRTCYALRSKPLEKFDVEDLRIMIGQQCNLQYLVPLALEFLAQNILSSGDMYEGDLLYNLLRIDSLYWEENIDEKSQMLRTIDRQWSTILAEDVLAFELQELEELIRQIRTL